MCIRDRLQGEEVLVGLQLRIALDRDEQPPERAGELVLRVLEFLELRGVVDGRGVDLDLARLGAGLDHRGQDLALLRGIALHRLHQIRDQVGAALILVLHLGPGGFRLFLQRRHVVVAAAGQHDAEHAENEPGERPAKMSRKRHAENPFWQRQN